MESDTLPPETLVAGRYRIVRELGRGGMGAVYVAEHVNTGGLWALKVMLDCTRLQAERASRFRREARASARITSEHVVKVTDADTAPELDGAPFIVMELLDGHDVERLLKTRGKLEAREAIDILTQVARGLDKAHAAGVVHRDLKPENVFIHRREDGTTIVKVLDFGISKVLRPGNDIASASVTGASDIMGTPLYMAPEQAAARHEQIGAATDVWAIGLMTVRMLTGTVYWQGDTIAEVFVQIMSEHRPAPSLRWPELGTAFDKWFQKSTAPKPADRFQSVGEQIAELTSVLTGVRPLLQSNPLRSDVGPAPQLVTQLMVAPDHSSNRPIAAAIGVSTSTAEPVITSQAIPLKPARGIFLAVAAVLVAVGAAVTIPMLRAQKTASITADSGSPTSSLGVTTTVTTKASGAGGEPSSAVPPSTAMAPTAPTVASTTAPTAASITTAATAPTTTFAVTAAPPTSASAVPVAAVPRTQLRPLQPEPVRFQPAQPTPPVTPPKPPPKPGDLFDTQK